MINRKRNIVDKVFYDKFADIANPIKQRVYIIIYNYLEI